MKLLVSDSHHPEFNLATEDFLFSKGEGEFAFFYSNDPCVVIGSNQVWRNEVDALFCEENQIPVLRRRSGGGAVYHDRGNLNYSFITHKTETNTGTTADFLNPVVEGLSRLGVMAVVGKRKDLWLPDGYKISGTASHVTMNRVMQHGTLLYDANLEMLSGALNPPLITNTAKGIQSVPSPVKNVLLYMIEQSGSRYIGLSGAKTFFQSLIEEIQQILNLEPGFELTDNMQKNIVAIQSDRYDKEEWNKRK